MAKLSIKPQALRQLEEIIAGVIEFTGFEISGIRLQNDIFDKLEQIAFHCPAETEMTAQKKVSPDVIALCMILMNKQTRSSS